MIDRSASMEPTPEQQDEAVRAMSKAFIRHALGDTHLLPLEYLEGLYGGFSTGFIAENRAPSLNTLEKPFSPADVTRGCVDAHSSFSQSASDQALREALSADMERRVNDARTDMGLGSLREAAAQKAGTPQEPSYRSSDEIMAAGVICRGAARFSAAVLK